MRALAAPAVCFRSRLAAQSCRAEKGERWGVGGDRERQERGAILTVLMPFSPERARPPGAHSLARRARPALQSPPAAPAAAHRQGSAAGAKRRKSEARRARRPRWNGDGPETDSAPTAQRPSARRLPPRGLGRSRLPPPTPRPSGPESPAGDARPRPGPAPRSCGSGLRSELRSGAGLKVCSARPWEGMAGREESGVCTGILRSLGFRAARGPTPRRDWKLVRLTFEESEGDSTLLHSQRKRNGGTTPPHLPLAWGS